MQWLKDDRSRKNRHKNSSKKFKSKNSLNHSTKKFIKNFVSVLEAPLVRKRTASLRNMTIFSGFFKKDFFFSFLYLSVYVVRVVLHKKYIWFMTYLTSWMQPICFTFFESKVRLKKSCEKALFLIQNLRIWVYEYLLLFIIVEFSLAFVQKYCYEYFSFVT